MKLTCPISQLTYSTNIGYGTGSSIHPALTQPLKQLVANLPSYYSGRIAAESPDSLYLYKLAWLCQLPDITFRTPVNRPTAEPALTGVLDRMISLVTTVQQHKHIHFPALVIDKESANLDTLKFYLDSLEECITEAKRSGRELSAAAKLTRIESTLERMVLSQLKAHRTKTSKLIAEWAALAADFPMFRVTVPGTGKEVPCSEYWQLIITNSFVESTNTLLELSIPVADIEELIDHCEDYIPHGTVYASVLMRSLRAARDTVAEMLTPAGVAKSLTKSADSALTGAASTKPVRSQFASNLEYIKALVKWQQAAVEIKYSSIDL